MAWLENILSWHSTWLLQPSNLLLNKTIAWFTFIQYFHETSLYVAKLNLPSPRKHQFSFVALELKCLKLVVSLLGLIHRARLKGIHWNFRAAVNFRKIPNRNNQDHNHILVRCLASSRTLLASSSLFAQSFFSKKWGLWSSRDRPLMNETSPVIWQPSNKTFLGATNKVRMEKVLTEAVLKEPVLIETVLW